MQTARSEMRQGQKSEMNENAKCAPCDLSFMTWRGSEYTQMRRRTIVTAEVHRWPLKEERNIENA